MRYLSLFSGIEAATVAWAPLGWECAAVAEIEPFPCAVLAHHYPNVPNLGDVTKITESDVQSLGNIDLVIFGSPCQDLSFAGKRKGLIHADGTITRSGLFFTAVNIARWAGARFWVWENVPGAYSSNKGRDFAAVVEFMAGLDDVDVPRTGWGSEGCAVGDNGLLEWGCLDAQWFGVAQRRRRVFAILDTGDWSSRLPILLERESLRGDSAPGRNSGKEIATEASGCAASYGIPGNWIGRAPENGGNAVEPMLEVSPCLTATDRHGVSNGAVVRRLTPMECERLQDFPDGYTDVPGKKYAETHRYKALGNSMAVPVVRWIGRAIESSLRSAA